MAAPAGVRAGGGESSGASSAGGVSGRVEKKASAAGHRREGTRAESAKSIATIGSSEGSALSEVAGVSSLAEGAATICSRRKRSRCWAERRCARMRELSTSCTQQAMSVGSSTRLQGVECVRREGLRLGLGQLPGQAREECRGSTSGEGERRREAHRSCGLTK
jgi:hypothetical protein